MIQWARDVPTSTEWYRRFLDRDPLPYVTAYFRLDEGSYLILGNAASGTGRGGTGVWFEVDDVLLACEELEKGLAFEGPPCSESRPGCWRH